MTNPSMTTVLDREPLTAWASDMADLPWGDPAFSERMLREHLDQRHDHASRRTDTIDTQVDRLVGWLGLAPGDRLLDLTCGPGLFARAFAERGIAVTGVDIAPAAIRHAREMTAGLPCTFIEGDVRAVDLGSATFDAAVYLYGQYEVLEPHDAPAVIDRVRAALRPGAPLAVEIREPSRIDRTLHATWWTSADDVYAAEPHLVLGEHGWDAAAGATVDRYFVVDARGVVIDVFGVTERVLEPEALASELARAGLPGSQVHPGWDGLAFEASADWVLVVAR
jgi:2-polyprenyl-3-methyl-5-hydroxy-6-metoxy-1,4-benzoquinol methylase